MLSYVIVGSGYRSEYFARIARDYPHLFRALYLCRSVEKVALMSAHTGIPATMSIDECLAFEPDFAVIAVDRPHIPDVAEEWLDRGIPVLVETPIANSADKLRRLWERGSAGDKIVCCEQYHRYPILAAGLRAVRRGRIGTPTSLYLSLLHDYHGASILRHALDVPVGEPVTMYGFRHTAPVVETDSRYGAVYDGRTRDEERDVISLSFASGKMALIDFSPVQYRSAVPEWCFHDSSFPGQEKERRSKNGAHILVDISPERWPPRDSYPRRCRTRHTYQHRSRSDQRPGK